MVAVDHVLTLEAEWLLLWSDDALFVESAAQPSPLSTFLTIGS